MLNTDDVYHDDDYYLDEYLKLMSSNSIDVNLMIKKGFPPPWVKINKFYNLLNHHDKHNRNISLKNIKLSFPGLTLIDDSNLTLSYGTKYGLIGRNGTGKTSLLNYILNQKYYSIHVVEQMCFPENVPVIDYLLSTDKEREWLIKTKTLLESNDYNTYALHYDINDIHQRLSEIKSDSSHSKASAILFGLGFNKNEIDKPLNNFSGGQRMIISLASALFIEPNILMLDEPTNHLDIYAIAWLENYLKNIFKGTLLVISHNKDFLNNVADCIIHLHMKKLTLYQCNYYKFEQQRIINKKINNDKYDKYIKEEKKLKKLLNDPKNNNSSNAKKKLSKLQKVEMDVDEKKYELLFPKPDNIGFPILQFKNVTFKYEDKIILKNVDFGFDLNSKIGLVGRNGSGKTTLIKLMNKEIDPNIGEVWLNRKLKISKFDQHNISSLPQNITPLEHLKIIFKETNDQIIRSHLSKSGIYGKLQTKNISFLSGGQKARLSFACITYNNPHLLFLDEPTNHLDMESINSLSKSLKEFKGGFMLITHDKYILSEVCNEIWLINNKFITKYHQPFDDYFNNMLVNQ